MNWNRTTLDLYKVESFSEMLSGFEPSPSKNTAFNSPMSDTWIKHQNVPACIAINTINALGGNG